MAEEREADGPATAAAEEAALFDAWRRRRDREALAVLFARWRDPAWRVARRITGDDADAEDVVQQAMVRVMERAGGYGGHGPVRAWVLAIVGNAARNLVRARNRRRRHEQGVLHDIPKTVPPQTELTDAEVLSLLRAVREALAAMPANEGRPLVMRFIDGLSVAEIAAGLERSAGTVRMQLHRGLKRLRRQLARRGHDLSSGALGCLVPALVPALGAMPTAPAGLAERLDLLATRASLPRSRRPPSPRSRSAGRWRLRVLGAATALAVGGLVGLGIIGGRPPGTGAMPGRRVPPGTSDAAPVLCFDFEGKDPLLGWEIVPGGRTRRGAVGLSAEDRGRIVTDEVSGSRVLEVTGPGEPGRWTMALIPCGPMAERFANGSRLVMRTRHLPDGDAPIEAGVTTSGLEGFAGRWLTVEVVEEPYDPRRHADIPPGPGIIASGAAARRPRSVVSILYREGPTLLQRSRVLNYGPLERLRLSVGHGRQRFDDITIMPLP